MKQKEKEDAKGDDFIQKQVESAKGLKKFKDKLAKLDKDKQDAQASGDQVLVDKIDLKIRQVKSQLFFAKDKIEKKIIKKYRKIQEKEVQKRMKKSKKKANRVNENKPEPLFKRLVNKLNL